MTITTDRDQVRLLIGDTDSTRPIFFDDELDLFLSNRANVVLLAAADACQAASAKFARDYDFKWKDGQFSRSQMAKHYADLARTLRGQAPGALSTIETTRVDGYSDDLSARDGAGQNRRTGRVRQGYTDPDLPY